MHAITDLQNSYFRIRLGLADIQSCINWAIERLQSNEEGDDLDIVLLAAASRGEDAYPLVEKILSRYVSRATLDDELAAGKFVVELYEAYLERRESIQSLDEKINRLYYSLGYPTWLAILSRNCEYATDVSDFISPFEQEFEYIADLWSQASSRADFQQTYSREVSNDHDLKHY